MLGPYHTGTRGTAPATAAYAQCGTARGRRYDIGHAAKTMYFVLSGSLNLFGKLGQIEARCASLTV
jgi:hypothetical protein